MGWTRVIAEKNRSDASWSRLPCLPHLTLLSTSERDGSCGGSFLASYVDDGQLNLNQLELYYYYLFIERGEIISLIIRDIDICQNNGLKDINN